MTMSLDEVMLSIYNDIESTKKGDSIHASFWEVEPNMILVPNSKSMYLIS